MIDVHCHLAAEEFSQDLDDVISKAKQAGVKGCLNVTEFLVDFERSLDIVKIHKGFIWTALGIHPVQLDTSGNSRAAQVSDLTDDVLLHIQENSEKNNIIAIGEYRVSSHERAGGSHSVRLIWIISMTQVGLDFTPWYHIKKDGAYITHDEQRAVFQKQIEMAKNLDLPVNCHSRSAGKPTLEMLHNAGVDKALLHAFDGNWKIAMKGAQNGYFFSIPPSISRSPQKQELVKHLPMANILLETDSPALGPVKGERNEVANITISAEWISKLKNIPIEDVCQITNENAIKIFPCFAD